MRALLMGVVVWAFAASAAPEVLPPTPETMSELQKIEGASYRPGAVDTFRLKYQDVAKAHPAEVMPRIFVAWCTLPSDDAWNQLKAVATIYPDHPWARYGMGRIYTNWKGMSDLAKTEFEAVLKRDPTFYPAVIGLGDVARVKQKYPQAEEKYRAALVMHEDPFARAGLGLTLAALGKSDEARVELRKAIAALAEQPAAIAMLVKLSVEAKDPEIIVAAQALADLRPRDREARKMLADLRYDLGEKATAAKEYERLIPLGNVDRAVFERLAAIYRELADVEGEERTLLVLSAMDEKATAANERLAELKLGKKDFEGAEAQWLEVLKRAPNQVAAREKIAKMKLDQGLTFAALEQYRLALALDPSAQESVAAVDKLEKTFKLPKKHAHGNVNNVYWAVQWSLGQFYESRKTPGLAGKFKLRARITRDGTAAGVDVLEDSLKDEALLGHAYFGLRDAEYPKEKVEPVFEFELGAKKKGK